MVSDYLPANKAARILLYIVGGVALAVVVGLALGILVQLLWNYTIAVMFNLSPITYWQAFALFILAKLLFGFGGGAQSGDQKKKKKREQEQAAEAAPDDDAGLPDDESFRKYWQEEGRAAYEAFLSSRRDGGADVAGD